MKYTLNLDTNNYVLSIAHTPNDNIELDLSTIDLAYLNAYQYLDGELVLDEVKLKELKGNEEQKAKAEQIAELKKQLADTDYEAIKYSEGWFTDEEYAPIKAKRESLREQIRKLESEE